MCTQSRVDKNANFLLHVVGFPFHTGRALSQPVRLEISLRTRGFLKPGSRVVWETSATCQCLLLNRCKASSPIGFEYIPSFPPFFAQLALRHHR